MKHKTFLLLCLLLKFATSSSVSQNIFMLEDPEEAGGLDGGLSQPPIDLAGLVWTI